MTTPLHLALTLLLQAAPAPDAAATGWQLGERVLTYSEAGNAVYRFDCTGSELVVTQYGVTSLLDVKANKPVADNAGTSLPEGASNMAINTDKTEVPKMVAASSARNPVRGWDMTIRLRKNDSDFRSLPRARMLSLFTTGFTRAVELSKADRTLIGTFVTQCRAGG